MRFRGRRFWHDLIIIYRLVEAGGIDGGQQRTQLTSELRATVNPVTSEERVQYGLGLKAEVYWFRFNEQPGLVIDPETTVVRWNNSDYAVRSVSHQPGYDYQVMGQLIP